MLCALENNGGFDTQQRRLLEDLRAEDNPAGPCWNATHGEIASQWGLVLQRSFSMDVREVMMKLLEVGRHQLEL